MRSARTVGIFLAALPLVAGLKPPQLPLPLQSATPVALKSPMPLVKALRGGGGVSVPRRPLSVLLPSIAAFILASSPASAAAAAANQVNCVGPAAAFFSNIRTPAALVAGAALGNLWVQIGPTTKDPKLAKRYQTIYSILMINAVILEFSTVCYATATDVRLMSGGYSSPMASSTLEFLQRELELPFVACRLHFLLGIVSFLASLAVRAVATLPGNTGIAAAMLLFGGISSTFCMISVGINGFVGLVLRYCQLWLAKNIVTIPGVLTLAFMATAVFHLAKESPADIEADKKKA